MCELLGMSANTPTDICFSFSGLMQRGGNTGPHADGWGIAFYEGKMHREFKDPQPSFGSEIARLVKNYPIKSNVVIGHIRQANSGQICLENTHPFSRELWGRSWVYAHNGQLRGIKKWRNSFYRPIGTTDSEKAFCWLMDQIRDAYPTPPRSLKSLWDHMAQCCGLLTEKGVFNLLLSDSCHLYAYCSTKLCWITRRAPFGMAQLKDDDVVVDFVRETTPNDVVTVVSTEPLTVNEDYHFLKKGDFIVFKKGEVVFKKQVY